MWMTENEIARSYREARNRKHQIYILADLNLCSVSEIKAILEEKGEIKPKKSTKTDMGDTLNTQKGEIEDKEVVQNTANTSNLQHGEVLNTQKSNKKGDKQKMPRTKQKAADTEVIDKAELLNEAQKVALTPGLKKLILLRLDQLEIEIIGCEQKRKRLEEEYYELAGSLGL